jgi:hypothetical protein
MCKIGKIEFGRIGSRWQTKLKKVARAGKGAWDLFAFIYFLITMYSM